MKQYVLVGTQCLDVYYGGVFNTLEEAKEQVIRIICDCYADWFADCDEPGTLREYAEKFFDGNTWSDTGGEADGMVWQIKEYNGELYV